MRTESDLREAMDELADTARSPEVVATRIAAERRRQLNPRGAGSILLAAAAVVAVAAIATPLVLNARTGGDTGATAAGGPRAGSAADLDHHAIRSTCPPTGGSGSRRVTPAAEVTILATPDRRRPCRPSSAA